MNKLEIKKEFQGVISVLNAKDNKLVKNLWISYLIFLKDTEQINDKEYLELFKEF